MQRTRKNITNEGGYYSWKDRILDNLVHFVIIIILLLITLLITIRTIKYIQAEQIWR